MNEDEYPQVSSDWRSDGELVVTVRRQRYLKTQFKLREGELPGVVEELEGQIDGE